MPASLRMTAVCSISYDSITLAWSRKAFGTSGDGSVFSLLLLISQPQSSSCGVKVQHIDSTQCSSMQREVDPRTWDRAFRGRSVLSWSVHFAAGAHGGGGGGGVRSLERGRRAPFPSAPDPRSAILGGGGGALRRFSRGERAPPRACRGPRHRAPGQLFLQELLALLRASLEKFSSNFTGSLKHAVDDVHSRRDNSARR